MTDDVVVISSTNGMARVKVTPKIVCCECSARALCQAKNNPEGMLMVLDPLTAKPGDTVTIEIPEDNFSREITRIFSVLLIAALIGFGLGSMVSLLLHLPVSESGLLGFMSGVVLGGIYIYHDFRDSRQKNLYPVITAIHSLVNKGEFNGKA